MKKLIVLIAAALCACAAGAAELKDYIPSVGGLLRARYEYVPSDNVGRFQVKNARVNVTGRVIPIVSYKVEVDLCAEGSIKVLDAWARVRPVSTLDLTAGQMRVPFGLAVRRSPANQYFANQTFLGVEVGNRRDVGLSAGWSSSGAVPVTLEGGVFNGSGLTSQKGYWTDSYLFALSASAMCGKRVKLTTSMMKLRPEATMYLWDLGAFYDDTLWHVEGEYIREWYLHGAFSPVNAVDLFVVRNFPMRHALSNIAALARYDYMCDHSDGKYDLSGHLAVNDPSRQRLTAGMTLSFAAKRLRTDIRLNYEQYFYHSGAPVTPETDSKIVAELVCTF